MPNFICKIANNWERMFGLSDYRLDSFCVLWSTYH